MPQPMPLISERLDDGELLRFGGLSRLPGLVHAVTARPWNMAPHRGPQRELAVARRHRLCEHLGVPFERLTAPDQIHSHHVVRVEAGDVGAGRLGRDGAIRFVDGLVSNLVNTPLLQLSGDCPLILVFDPARRVLGTGHASWRGTVAGLTTQLVRAMVEEFASRPADLWAGIAPCAGGERYEVRADVVRVARRLLVNADRYLAESGSRWRLDLKRANLDQLLEAGIPIAQCEVAAECTLSDARFFSHRRDGAETGRNALIAAILN